MHKRKYIILDPELTKFQIDGMEFENGKICHCKSNPINNKCKQLFKNQNFNRKQKTKNKKQKTKSKK
jgi:hypothetical protein